MYTTWQLYNKTIIQLYNYKTIIQDDYTLSINHESFYLGVGRGGL